MINATYSVGNSTQKRRYICNVLKHRGEILENIIRGGKVKVSIAELSRKLDYDRSTIYHHFKNPNLDFGILLKYGRALKYDFSKEFPELIEYGSIVEEPLSEYKALTVSEALQERDFWKDKYIRLLEKHNEMIMEQLRNSKE